jgi:hypothetical protein
MYILGSILWSALGWRCGMLFGQVQLRIAGFFSRLFKHANLEGKPICPSNGDRSEV